MRLRHHLLTILALSAALGARSAQAQVAAPAERPQAALSGSGSGVEADAPRTGRAGTGPGAPARPEAGAEPRVSADAADDRDADRGAGAAPAGSDTEAGEAGADSGAVVEQQPAGDVEELRRRIDILAEEIEQLRSGEETVEVSEERRRALGLGPSAAAIYERRRGVSIAGYGEMLYENYAEENERGEDVSRSSQLDFLRAILYAGYRFNDRLIFNSEIEFEHTNEVSLEFAYIDYLVNDSLTVRGGLLLVPIGLVNEFHEPTVFIGARRPETEQRIIPSTWRENGVGVLGSAGPFNYRAFVVNGLTAGGFTSDGLRGGRQKGARALASDLAFAGRLDYAPMPGVFVGTGLYTGGADHGALAVGGAEIEVDTRIVEVHGQAQLRGWDLRGLFARADLDGVAALNRARGLSGSNSVGEELTGGYLQLGYNLLAGAAEQRAATPYYRFERINTQAAVPAGFSINPARDGVVHTVGIELRPIYNVVVKTDYQWFSNEADTGRNQFNILLGYAF